MLIQKELKNFGIDKDELEKTTILQGEGKVVKIFVEFEENTEGTNLTITTKEGEVILDVDPSLEPEIYYPRINTMSQRYQGSISAVVEENQARMEQFSFFGGLSIRVERDKIGEAQKIIKKLTVLFDA